MPDAILKNLIEILGVVVLSILTAIASRKGESEEQASIARIAPLWIVFQGLAGGVAGAMAGVAGEMAGDLGSWGVFGALIGTAQWLALRGAGLAHPLWVPASIIGWIIYAFLPTPYTWAICGLVAGTLQAVLCRSVVAHGLAWAIACTFAWLVAGVGGTAVGFALLEGFGFALAWVIGWIVVGVLGGTITAFALSTSLNKS